MTEPTIGHADSVAQLPSEQDTFLADRLALPSGMLPTTISQVVEQIVFAALGASLANDRDRLLMLLETLTATYGRAGADQALHYLCSAAVQPISHSGTTRCSLIATFDVGAVQVDQRPVWERAVGIATDLLSGTMTGNGIRLTTGMKEMSGPLIMPVLEVMISHVRDLIELSASIQGAAFEAYDLLTRTVKDEDQQ